MGAKDEILGDHVSLLNSFPLKLQQHELKDVLSVLELLSCLLCLSVYEVKVHEFFRPFLYLLMISAYRTSTGSKFVTQSAKICLFFNRLKPTSC